MQHSGQLAGVGALGVVLLRPAPCPVTPPPGLLLRPGGSGLLVVRTMLTVRVVAGGGVAGGEWSRAKRRRGAGQEGQDPGQGLRPPERTASQLTFPSNIVRRLALFYLLAFFTFWTIFSKSRRNSFRFFFQGNVVSSQDGTACFECALIGETTNKNITSYSFSLLFSTVFFSS